MAYYLAPWFDAHVHFRDDQYPWTTHAFNHIVRATARQCHYAVVMPNSPKIETFDDMVAYRSRILQATRHQQVNCPDFEPLMTLYLTSGTSIGDIERAACTDWFAGVKLYPQGVTTGSDGGVSDYRDLATILRRIENLGIRLLIHGEKPMVDPRTATDAFVREDLPVIRDLFGGIIVFEHCPTAESISAVENDPNMRGSITPQHSTGIYEQMLKSPHNHCKPVWATEYDRQALLRAIATPGQTKFFAGSDSAPHPVSVKDTKGAYGCFSAPVALQWYIVALEEAGATLDGFNRFLYGNAAEFYGKPKEHTCISTSDFDGHTMLVREYTFLEEKSPHPSLSCLFYRDSDGANCDLLSPMRPAEPLPYRLEYTQKREER